MEIDAETVATQGRAADHSTREVQATEPNSSINQSQVEDGYSIAHDRPRKEIRKSHQY